MEDSSSLDQPSSALDLSASDSMPVDGVAGARDTLMDDGAGLHDPDDDKEEPANLELLELHRMWRNEKYAPELLPFNPTVVLNIAEVAEFVGEQLDEEKAEDADPNDPSMVLRSADLERVRYVLRDYLRIRLWKITQWPLHYLNGKYNVLLSKAENKFLKEYWDHKQKFFEVRLLGALPPSKHSLDEKVDLSDMVRRPCLNKFVYARVTGDLGPVEVPASLDPTSDSTSATRTVEYTKGRTYLIRYAVIRQFLLRKKHAGKIELV